MMKTTTAVSVIGFVCAALAGCASEPPPPAEAPIEEAPLVPESEKDAPDAEAETAAPAPAPISLSATVEAKSKSKLTGNATFTEVEGGVKVVISLEGATPGDHGVHVHEKGDCSAADATSAGEHFNPGGHEHALPEKDARHLGDFGNITVGKDGKGTLELVATGANLKSGDPNSFAGRALVVHAKKDDGRPPIGNSGARIGCAVIQPAS